MIYLDNNATTPIHPDVFNVLNEAYSQFGNPSSTHSQGQAAKNKVTKSRRLIASYLNVDPQEIIFTSGATEGLNFLIQPKGHCITSSIEHSCVFAQFEQTKNVTFLSPQEGGCITASQVLNALKPDTQLITIMAANNETGVINEWEEISKIALTYNIPFIVDGVTLLGKMPFAIPQGVTGMAFSGHKIHAPMGIGFIYLKRGTNVKPLISGGGQERSLRAGTENVPGITALAKAIELIEYPNHLRDEFEQKIMEQITHVLVNGTSKRVGNTSNLSFLDVDGESLLFNLDLEGVCASHGSACSSGALEPSRILLNMGLPRSQVKSSIRFSFSRFNTQKEVDAVVEILKSLVARLRY